PREAAQRREPLPRAAATRRDAGAAAALQSRVDIGVRAVRHREAARGRRILVLEALADRALRRGRAGSARADESPRRLRRDAFRRVPPGAADDDSAARRRRRARARLGDGVVTARRLAGHEAARLSPASGAERRGAERFDNGSSAWLRARRLLVIRADNIGDVVMTGPALRAIRRALPEAKLTLLASPAGAQAAPL